MPIEVDCQSLSSYRVPRYHGAISWPPGLYQNQLRSCHTSHLAFVGTSRTSLQQAYLTDPCDDNSLRRHRMHAE